MCISHKYYRIIWFCDVFINKIVFRAHKINTCWNWWHWHHQAKNLIIRKKINCNVTQEISIDICNLSLIRYPNCSHTFLLHLAHVMYFWYFFHSLLISTDFVKIWVQWIKPDRPRQGYMELLVLAFYLLLFDSWALFKLLSKRVFMCGQLAMHSCNGAFTGSYLNRFTAMVRS